MLSVGLVLGGPEESKFGQEVRSLMKFVRKNRERGFGGAEVNIVFHVPGSLKKPDYVGLRTGTFSKKERCQMVQVSVEDEFATSNDTERIRRYVFDVADEAIGIGKSALEKKKLAYDIELDRSLLDMWLSLGGEA